MITTVKQLKAENIIGHSIYRLSRKFEVHGSPDKNGEAQVDVWSEDEYLTYDGKVLTAHADGSKINPAILFKAQVYLLTPREWS